ncbi:MAG: VOC family protein [bacterium]
MLAKYVHTNLIAEDWRRLAKFYIDVFGCEAVPPERDYKGEAMDTGTGLKDVHLTGIHLRLPGYGNTGPTLELFNYENLEPVLKPIVNRPGWGHIAFEVDDVEDAFKNVIANGGKPVGKIVTLTTQTGSKVTWCYMTDPEGNMIELQTWEK